MPKLYQIASRELHVSSPERKLNHVLQVACTVIKLKLPMVCCSFNVASLQRSSNDPRLPLNDSWLANDNYTHCGITQMQHLSFQALCWPSRGWCSCQDKPASAPFFTMTQNTPVIVGYFFRFSLCVQVPIPTGAVWNLCVQFKHLRTINPHWT